MSVRAAKLVYMQFFVPKYVSSVTYDFGTPISVSYIVNTKTHFFILLDGISSDLWYIILNAENDIEIEKFVKINSLTNEFDDFICQLNEVGLLENKSILKNSNDKLPLIVENSNYEEVEKFETDLDKFQIDNKILGNLFFELTHKCNLNCIHCFQSDHNDNTELKFEKIKEIIDEAIHKGLFTVTLSGGECTLNKDFLKIAKYIREKRLRLCLITNGQVLNDNPTLFNELVNLYPQKISLSLYGITPDTHDKITQVKGSFNKTINVINKLKANNIYVQIKYFILSNNIHEFKQVLDYGKENKISIQYSAHLINNFSNNNAKLKLSDDELYNLITDKESVLYVGNSKPVELNSEYLSLSACKGGINSLTIYPNLDVSFCPTYKISLGNLNDKSIVDIWTGEKNIECQNKKRKDIIDCFNKEYCKFCTYCPSFSIAEGNGFGKSDILCKIAKLKLKAYNELICEKKL